MISESLMLACLMFDIHHQLVMLAILLCLPFGARQVACSGLSGLFAEYDYLLLLETELIQLVTWTILYTFPKTKTMPKLKVEPQSWKLKVNSLGLSLNNFQFSGFISITSKQLYLCQQTYRNLQWGKRRLPASMWFTQPRKPEDH